MEQKDSMKVAIITYHYPANYGAVLQCLALQRVLTKLDVDAEVLDYRPDSSRHLPFWRGWGIRKGQILGNLVKRWIKFRYADEMERKFDEFRADYFKLSPRCSTKEEVATLADHYDVFVAGSDQVWHFAKESVYFLDWGQPYSGKRISYAPCCGMLSQPDGNRENIRKWIMNVDCLSVRNRFSHDLVHNLTGLNPEIVADPTLLVDLSDVACEMNLPCSEYILMYTLGEEIKGGHAKVIESIREKVGNLPVVAVVPSAHKPHRAPWADHVVYEAGPRGWLWLIENSAFIYTDSFHGVLFALNNSRPFLAFYAEQWRAPRLMDLAERYSIQERVVGSADEAKQKLSEPWSHDRTERQIAQHVDGSLGFLKNAVRLDVC